MSEDRKYLCVDLKIIDNNINGRMKIAMENALVIESDCFRDIQGI